MKKNKLLIGLAIALILVAIGAFFTQAIAQTKSIRYDFNEKDSTFKVTNRTDFPDGQHTEHGGKWLPDSLYAAELELRADAIALELQKQKLQSETNSVELKKQSDKLEAQTGKDYNERLADFYNKNLEGDWSLSSDTSKVDLTYRELRFRQKEAKNFPIKPLSKNAFLLQNFIKEDVYFEKKKEGRWIGKQGENNYILKKQ